MIDKIKIGWKVYDIKKSESALNSGDELYGQIDYNTQVITLRAQNSMEQDECTLIHEILHGVDDIYGFGFEEDVVERLSNALYALVVDNRINLFAKKE